VGHHGVSQILSKLWELRIPPEDWASTINYCVMRVSQAILKLQKKVIRWPDDEEWKQIGSRIEQTYGFVNCVGLNDGTLFVWPLHKLRIQKIISHGKDTM